MPTEELELLIDLGQARDQGPRPTCLSFSLSEIHRTAIKIDELLSPESLHRRATERAKRPHSEGLTVSQAVDALTYDGQTTELAWPYDLETPFDVDCAYYRVTSTLLPFDPGIAIASLRAGQPLSLIINVDLEFFGCVGLTSIDLVHDSQIQGRHAVVICGLRESASGHDFFIKNSWGVGWGARGHAWLTSDYVFARSPQLIRI